MRSPEADSLARSGRPLLFAWIGASAAAAVAMGAGIAIRGTGFFYAIQGPADGTRVEVKFAVFALAWTWLGALLAATQRPEQLRRHASFAVSLLLLGILFLVVVRGPHKVEHKDFSNYFTAATHMREGIPLSQDPFQRYLYPPLLATLVEPLVPLGLGPASWAFRFSNYGALLLLAVLLYLSLQRLGAARAPSGMLVLLALGANVAVLDNFASQQVNLHVANLILASLLLFGRRDAWSSALMALAAHLKFYPLLLAAPFAVMRRGRWLAGFAGAAALVVAGTSAVNSFSYYAEFADAATALREPGIRNASVASFVQNTARLAGISLGAAERPVSLALELGLAALVLRWGAAVLRRGSLARAGTPAERTAWSAAAVLSVVMLVVSPSIWPHHLVFALLPALAVALTVSTAREALLLAVAWFLLFLVPVHEVYPFSYLRLVGLLLLGRLFACPGPRADSDLPPLVDSLTSALTGPADRSA